MGDMTDQQLADAGWLWVLRDSKTGKALAVTTLASDAGQWMNESRGSVTNLLHSKEQGDE